MGTSRIGRRTVGALARMGLMISAVAAVTGTLATVPAQADPAGPCPSLYVLAIPGTWEPSSSPNGMLSAVTSGLPATVQADYVPYPATAFPWEGEVYGASKRRAVDTARGMLAAMQARCGDTRFGVIGYSQGADAAGDLAAEIGTGGTNVRPDKVVAVGLLSDPRRAESDALVGPRVPGIGAGGPRLVGFGLLGDRTVTFCAPGDLYCSTERADFVTRMAGLLAQNSAPGALNSPSYEDQATALWNEVTAAGGVPVLQGQLTDQANVQRRDQLAAFYGSGAHQSYQGYTVDAAGNTPVSWLAGWLREKA